MSIGIIGGSGLYDLKGFKFIEDIKIKTKYGEPSSNYLHYTKNDTDFFFLSRHGENHKIPPHQINSKANVDGFKQLGVSEIFSFTAVGSLNTSMKPGDIVIPDNAFDFTHSRASTFFENGSDVYHIDFTEPFCPKLRKKVFNVLETSKYQYHVGGVYICTNGPRLETKAEIKIFKQWGVDIVG
jgi:5'-methylthioadenosine phosphorylase